MLPRSVDERSLSTFILSLLYSWFGATYSNMRASNSACFCAACMDALVISLACCSSNCCCTTESFTCRRGNVTSTFCNTTGQFCFCGCGSINVAIVVSTFPLKQDNASSINPSPYCGSILFTCCIRDHISSSGEMTFRLGTFDCCDDFGCT